jgi:hypothetical protein
MALFDILSLLGTKSTARHRLVAQPIPEAPQPTPRILIPGTTDCGDRLLQARIHVKL